MLQHRNLFIHLYVSIYMAVNLKKTEKISKALGDVNRLRILNHIAINGGTGQCSAIQGCLDLAQPSVSHHIKILIEAELIEAEKEGRHYKYLLKQEVLDEYLAAVASLGKTCKKHPAEEKGATPEP